MTDSLQDLPRYPLADYEQWDGFPVSLNPPATYRHQQVAGQILYRFCTEIKDGKLPLEVIQTCDWRIDQHTVVRPDIQLFDEPVETEWVEQTPALIVEITSPVSDAKDRGYKRGLYVSQGVRHYLIVDPEAQTVEALVLQGDGYAPLAPGDGVVSFDLHDGCAVSLEVGALWA